MNKLKRGDLIKADAAAPSLPSPSSAIYRAFRAAAQYWYAYYDKSIGLVTKVDVDHIWVCWCGSRSDNANHMYLNKSCYFNLVSRNE